MLESSRGSPGRRKLPGRHDRPIRVLLVDAHQLLARSLALILDSDPALEVLGTAASPDEALAEIRVAQPHVVLASYFLLHVQGGSLPVALREEFPDVKLLVLIATPDPATVSQCIEAGAVGCVSRDQPPEELVDSISRAHAGEFVFPAEALRKLLKNPQVPRPRREPTSEPIGRREREVLQNLALGATIEETADRLSISAHTVRTHLKNAMAKLEVHSRLEAVLLGHRLGLIELPD